MATQRGLGVRDRSWPLDAIGLGLLAALTVWLGIAGARNGVDGRDVQLVVLGAGTAHVVGRWWTRSSPTIVPACLWVIGLLIVARYGERLLENPTGPFGYANAAAAFATVLCGAALFAATRARRAFARGAWMTAAVGAFLFPWVNGSLAGALGTGLLAASLVLWARRRNGRRLLGAGAALVGLCLAVSVTLGALHVGPGNGHEGVLPDGLTGRRTTLWSEAWQMFTADPVDGTGPGGFALHSPTARADPDASWTHNLYLQVAAEAGSPGVVLLLLVAGWAYVRLTREPLVSAGPTVVGVTLTAVLIHSTVDYVLHFPAIVLALAALHGAGTAARGGSDMFKPEPRGRGDRWTLERAEAYNVGDVDEPFHQPSPFRRAT